MKAASENQTPETEKTANEAITFLLTRLETVATEGFFYGSKVLLMFINILNINKISCFSQKNSIFLQPTWVDFYFTGLFDAINDRIPNVLQPYPNLIKLTNNIKNKDSVQKYIKKRPKPSL